MNTYNKIMQFNEEQKQILLGSLLGDGCIYKDKYDCYRYTILHSNKQKDYLLWKNSYLNFHLYLHKVNKTIKNYKYKLCHYEISKYNSSFKNYYNLFYPNGKKIVIREILDVLKPIGIAVWFMDDGSYSYSNNIIMIYTNSFTLNECNLIKKWFKERFNIECRVQRIIQTINKNNQYILRFNVINTQKFIEMIKSYVLQIPSMTYKIGLDIDRKVIKVKTLERQRAYHHDNPQISKDYYLSNRGRILAQKKEYYSHPKIKLQRKLYMQTYYKEKCIKAVPK